MACVNSSDMASAIVIVGIALAIAAVHITKIIWGK